MTPRTSSYQAELEHRDLESELERLRNQALLSWRQEARLLSWLGLHDGMTVLELGSGPGFVTEQLRQLLPASRLIALDSDPAMLARGKQLVAGGPQSQTTWIHAGANATGLPDASCDFVLARYLFQHLPDPVAVAREARRVLKPGGKLAVIDVDAMVWGIVEPMYPQLQAIYARSGAEQAANGGNRLVGRRLWRMLTAAGFHEVELDPFAYSSDQLGLEPFLPQLEPDRLLPLVRSGRLSLHELTLATYLYQQFRSSPEAYVLLVGMLASGRA